MKKRVIFYSAILGYDYDLIVSSRGNRIVSLSRQIIWLKLRESGYGVNDIAAFFGRHHSVVSRGIQRTKDLVNVNDRFVIESLKKLSLTDGSEDMEMIAKAAMICESLRIPMTEIFSDSTRKNASIRRFIVYREMYNDGNSTADIARIFNRTPQSINHGIRQADHLEFVRDADFMKEFQKLF